MTLALLIGAPGTPQTFGDGFLCLSGTIRRIAAAHPSGSSAVFLVDPSASPASDVLTPGSTAGLQALFRDPASAGTGYNLSSAVRILALP